MYTCAPITYAFALITSYRACMCNGGGGGHVRLWVCRCAQTQVAFTLTTGCSVYILV